MSRREYGGEGGYSRSSNNPSNNERHQQQESRNSQFAQGFGSYNRGGGGAGGGGGREYESNSSGYHQQRTGGGGGGQEHFSSRNESSRPSDHQREQFGSRRHDENQQFRQNQHRQYEDRNGERQEDRRGAAGGGGNYGERSGGPQRYHDDYRNDRQDPRGDDRRGGDRRGGDRRGEDFQEKNRYDSRRDDNSRQPNEYANKSYHSDQQHSFSNRTGTHDRPQHGNRNAYDQENARGFGGNSGFGRQGGNERVDSGSNYRSGQENGHQFGRNDGGGGAPRNFRNDGGFGGAAPRDDRGGNYRSQNDRYDEGNRNQNYNRNSEYQNDRFGSGGGGGGHRYGTNSRFENDGGFDNTDSAPRNMGASGGERAPVGWVPEFDKVEDVMAQTAEKVSELDVNEDMPIEIRNSNISNKLSSWQNSGLNTRILANIERLGYKTIRPIQAALIPQITAGYDVAGQAETGGGKTAAFGLPIISRLMEISQAEVQDAIVESAPFALVLAPTRELAKQIYETLGTYAHNTGVKICLTYGQISRRESLYEINKGCHILVATCGRIMDFVDKRDISLNRLRFLVLDEADKLLEDVKTSGAHFNTIIEDEGFRQTDGKRQTILTSATFAGEVYSLAKCLMKPIPGETDLVRVVLSNGRLSKRVVCHFRETRTLIDKQSLLRSLLKPEDGQQPPKTLVFVETRQQCDNIAMKACIYLGANNAHSLHGERGQDTRDRLVREFRQNKVRVLVTTDVGSRGLDIPDLDRVINFDLPVGTPEGSVDTWIHRVGRCGRMHTGNAYTFVDSSKPREGQIAFKMVEAVKAQGQDREDMLPDWIVQLAKRNINNTSDYDLGYGSGGRGNANSGFSRDFGGSRSQSGFGGGKPGFGGGFGGSGGGFGGSSGGFGGSGGGFGGSGGGFGGSSANATTSSGGFGAKNATSGFGVTNLKNTAEQSTAENGESTSAEAETAPSADLGSRSFGGPASPELVAVPPAPTEKKEEANQGAEEDLEDEW
uniref:RNA helicase n=1 Tax=Caenorhabditis japonica TaxID=281687 RepID=A0A8R1E3C7_CAEJA